MDTVKANGQKRAAIYARVSTDEQASRGYSLPTQIEGARKYAASIEYRVDYEFEESFTGAKLNRPELDKLRDLIDKREIDAVIVYSSDRWTRSVAHKQILREELKEHGVELHYVVRGKTDDTPEGTMHDDMESVFDAYWREKITESSRRGRRRKAENNRWVGAGVACYGYKRDGVGKDVKLVTDDKKAEVVKRIFADYTGKGGKKPLSIQAIVKNLNEEAQPAPRGRKWTKSVVRFILTNEAYIGRHTWSGVIVNLPDLALIDKDTFAKALDRAERNKKLSQRNTKRQYLLSGFLYCTCGRLMHGHGVNTDGKDYLYYVCDGRRESNTDSQCREKVLRVDLVDGLLWRELADKLFDDDNLQRGIKRLAERKAAELEPKIKRVTTVTKLVESTDKKIGRLITDLADIDSDVVRAELKETIKGITKQREVLIKERDTLQAELNSVLLDEDTQNRIITTIAQIRTKVDGATFEQKRYILDKLNVDIRLRHDGAGRWLDVTCALGDVAIEVNASTWFFPVKRR